MSTINLYDYLELRGNRGLSDDEASVLGVELTSGWVKRGSTARIDKIIAIQALLYGAKSRSNTTERMKTIAEGLLSGKEFSDYIEVTGVDRLVKKPKTPKVKLKGCKMKPSNVLKKLIKFCKMPQHSEPEAICVITSDKLGVKPDWSAGTEAVALELFQHILALGKQTPEISDGVRKTDDNEFFRSQAWKTLRYNAFSLHGNNCQCCGVKAGNGVVLHVDHILPRATHPHLEYDIDNLQILCEDCNIGKLHIKSDDWRNK